MTNIVVIGVPYWIGKKDAYTGSVEMMKATGIADEIGAEWVDIAPDFDHYDDPVNAVNAALAQTIRDHAGKLPLIMAGDCTSCLGAVKGLQDDALQVLWYDAHGDFNTPETTPSGFLGGMPLAAMVGRGNQHLMQAIDLTPLPEQAITITDARDLDPEEETMLRDSALTWLPDVAQVMQQDWTGKPLYIHFDTDIVRTDEMPAMNYPAAGGPNLDESIASLKYALTHSQTTGVLFSLFNATLPGAELTRDNIVKVIRATVESL